MFKNILVPVDFSNFSDNAVKYALSLAEKFCSKIILYHAVVLFHEDFEGEAHLKAYSDIVAHKEKILSKRLESKCDSGKKYGVIIKSIMERGFSAPDLILDHITANKYNLVVMGTHGRTGLKKWLIGSVAEKVVRHSPIPLITVHQDLKKHRIKNVLIPVDFSKYAKKAVVFGLQIAKKLQARPHFLFVVTMETHPEYFISTFGSFLETNPEFKKDFKKRLKEFVGRPKEEATYAIVEGKAHEEIKNYAEKKRIDLIIMANHGMSALEHLLMGSTTERVVRVARCPVLTIHEDI